MAVRASADANRSFTGRLEALVPVLLGQPQDAETRAVALLGVTPLGQHLLDELFAVLDALDRRGVAAIPFKENMVAMAKEDRGRIGKASRNSKTIPATYRSMRGKSEKSRAFFIASIRTTPWAGAPQSKSKPRIPTCT